MIVFALIAAALIAIALAFVLPPLLRKDLTSDALQIRNDVNLSVLRDQLRELETDFANGVIDEQGYLASKQELEKRVLEDVKTAANAGTTSKAFSKYAPAIFSALLIPAIAIGTYYLVGSPAGIHPEQTQAQPEQQYTKEQVEQMVADLAAKLKDRPDDATGWNMLARSYGAMGRYQESADAFAHLNKIAPDNPDTLADYADALGMAKNQTLQGEPEKLIQQALKIDPSNVKALALSGCAAFERKEFKTAIAQWQKLLAQLPRDSELARSTLMSINQAQEMSGQAVTDMDATLSTSDKNAGAKTTSPDPKPNASKTVSGTVSLDPKLRSNVADTDTVFIYARATNGPKFPLAVLRKQVKDLPATFTLDDSMSMMPEAKLSAFDSVIVGARISKTGNATPSAGDVEGKTEAVKPGAKELKIVINSVRE
jgi:cytochrome c-type biogenesis protein CcmH